MRAICDRYGLPYNTGPLHRQFGSVVKKIFRLALPGMGAPGQPETEVEVEVEAQVEAQHPLAAVA